MTKKLVLAALLVVPLAPAAAFADTQSYTVYEEGLVTVDLPTISRPLGQNRRVTYPTTL